MSASIRVQPTEIPDVLEIETSMFKDDRGFFMETYNRRVWADAGFDVLFVQENLSLSRKGVLRGMHYQLAPHGMGKLIRVLTGAAFDVLVDLRRNAPTFGQWVGRELREDTPVCLWAPVGFAHGFLALCDNTRVLYSCTNYYTPQAERSISWCDPEVGIAWPFSPEIITEKDQVAPLLADGDYNFVWEGSETGR